MTMGIDFWLTSFAILLLLAFLLTAGTYLRRWRHQRKAQLFFNSLCTRYHLAPQPTEWTFNALIGLDREQKKLVVVEHRRHPYRWLLLKAEQIAGCTLQKTFGRPSASLGEERFLRLYTERIEVQLDLTGQERPLRLVFYEAERHRPRQLRRLEAQARHWDHLLSQWSKIAVHTSST